MNMQCSSGPWGLRDTHTLLEGPHLHLNPVRVAVEKALEKLQKHKCILGLRTKSWFILAGTLHLFLGGVVPKEAIRPTRLPRAGAKVPKQGGGGRP